MGCSSCASSIPLRFLQGFPPPSYGLCFMLCDGFSFFVPSGTCFGAFCRLYGDGPPRASSALLLPVRPASRPSAARLCWGRFHLSAYAWPLSIAVHIWGGGSCVTLSRLYVVVRGHFACWRVLFRRAWVVSFLFTVSDVGC